MIANEKRPSQQMWLTHPLRIAFLNHNYFKLTAYFYPKIHSHNAKPANVINNVGMVRIMPALK